MLFSGPNRERLNRIASVFLAVGLLRGSPVFAGPSVDEIVARAEQAAYYQGQDGRASVSMRITDKQGRERKRRFTILRSNSAGGEGEQKYYVHIASPSDLRNTVLMVWKHPAGEDDRWLYLPGLDLAKRIASGDKRTSFLGSDFYYEDISGRSPQHDRHVLKETTDNFYVLDNTPKNPESVEFSHFLAWIHKQTYLPVKVQFFDRSGSPSEPTKH